MQQPVFTYIEIEKVATYSDISAEDFMDNLWHYLIRDWKENKSRINIKIGKELKLETDKRNPGNVYQGIKDKLFNGVAMDYINSYRYPLG